MTPKEELIEALRQLCKREGGAVAVAEAAGVNDQTLYQILKGIKLPSGEPIHALLPASLAGPVQAGRLTTLSH